MNTKDDFEYLYKKDDELKVELIMKVFLNTVIFYSL